MLSSSGAPMLKLVMMGSSGAGKTSLVQSWIDPDNRGAQTKATIGLDMHLRQLNIDGTGYRVNIYDTAGQERFRAVVSQYYRGSHGAICVVDLCAVAEQCADQPAPGQTRDERIAAVLRKELSSIVDCKQMCALGAAEPAIYVLGNKLDRRDEIGAELLDEINAALRCLVEQQYAARYYDTSARTGHNVDAAFTAIAADMVRVRQDMLAARPELRRNLVDLSSTTSPTTTQSNNSKQCAC